MHSWEKPKPSQLLSSFKPAEKQIAFETKLYVDGQLKSVRWIKYSHVWPEVIGKQYINLLLQATDAAAVDEASTPDSQYPKPLLFPPFRSEILQQTHWNPNDKLGRIRLVLGEGIARFDCNGQAVSFQKLRDVVIFSFQHSPKELLAYASISWPNARMFEKAAMSTPRSDHQAHAHSPQGSVRHKTQPTISAMNGLHPTSSWSGSQTRTLVPDDPFVGPAVNFFGRKQHSSSGDVSMPDYPGSKRGTDMSGVSIAKPDFIGQINRANIDELVQALTPSKRAALMDALSPPDRDHGPIGTAQSNRIMSIKSLDKLTPRPGTSHGSQRKASSASRSTSGNSTVMSWDESPTLGDLWSRNHREFPGMLPTLQTSTRSKRSGSAGSKRKRSLSPPQLLKSSTDNLTGNTRGMSTSPCKKSPIPRKVSKQNAVEDEEGTGSDSDASEDDRGKVSTAI